MASDLSSSTAPRSSNAFKTIVDTIVAPSEAFQAIRTAPTWGWALAIAVVLAAVGSFLMIPALQHAMVAGYPAMIAHNPQLGQMSAAQQQTAMGFSVNILRFSWIFVVFGVVIAVLVSAAIMTLFNAIAHGEGSFGKYWAAASNISVIAAGLATIVTVVIVLVRGVTSFDSMQSVQGAMPSLALLAPSAGVKLSAFLLAFTPFSIWAAILTVIAMLTIGRVAKLPAWLAGIVILVIGPLFALAFAR